MARARLVTLGLIVMTVVIALVTLVPTTVHGRPEIDLCLVCGNIGVATLALNVILFMPFGFLARFRFGRVRYAVAAGLLFSFGIEVLQLFVPGRETALSDLLANTLGAFLGSVIALRPGAWFLPRSARSRIVATFGAALFTLTVLATGPLLDPAAPAGDYYGQWTPRGRTHPRYQGEVVSATIDGVPIPTQRLDDPDAVRAALHGNAEVHLEYHASVPTAVVVPVFRIVFGPYGEGKELYWIGTVDSTLIVWTRLHADDEHLSRPSLVMAGALRGIAPGATVDVRARHVVGEGYSVTVNGGVPWRFGYTVGRSWTLVYDLGLKSAWLLTLLDHLWFVGVAIVIGWYAKGWAVDATAFAAFSAAAVWAPRTSDLVTTPISLFVAVAVGLAAGTVLRRGLERSQRFVGVQTS